MESGDISSVEALMVDVVDMHMKADLLATAIRVGRTECINCLLRFGADPFLKQSDTRRTALYWAVLKDDITALQMLLRDIYRDPVDVVLESSSLASNLCEGIDAAGAKSRLDIRATPGSAWTHGVNGLSYRTRRAMNEALFEAASLGSLETGQFLIQNGANPNVFCYHDDEFLSWCPPLIAACYIPMNSFCKRSSRDAERMVALLVENGADVNAKNYVGDTAMHWAAACCLDESILVLLRNGADINAVNQLLVTPLQAAIDKNGSVCYYTVELLLKWGANVNDVDRSGWSALCYAINNANIPVVELLLSRGALTNYEWKRTEQVTMTTTPLFIATSLANRVLIRLLVAYGADVNRKAGSIYHPLSPFASCLDMNNFELAQVFLQLGADCHDAWNSVQSGIEKVLGTLPETMMELLRVDDRVKLSNLQLMKVILSVPLSLMNLCRSVINIKVLQKNIDLLPLPEALKSFLLFDDIH